MNRYYKNGERAMLNTILIKQKGLTPSQARYALDRSRKKRDYYIPQKRITKTPEFLTDHNIVVVKDVNSEYKYSVYHNGNKKSICKCIGSRYKDGRVKEYPGCHFWWDGKNHTISLAILVWLTYIKTDIPSNMVIDHIDNNSFNNELDNLQLLTIRGNIEKNPANKCNKYKKGSN